MSVEGDKKDLPTPEALSKLVDLAGRIEDSLKDEKDAGPKKPQGPIPIGPGKELSFLEAQLRELAELAADIRPPIPSNLGKLDMINLLRGRLVSVKNTAFAQGQTLATAAQLCRDDKITVEQYAEHVSKVRAILR